MAPQKKPGGIRRQRSAASRSKSRAIGVSRDLGSKRASTKAVHACCCRLEYARDAGVLCDVMHILVPTVIRHPTVIYVPWHPANIVTEGVLPLLYQFMPLFGSKNHLASHGHLQQIVVQTEMIEGGSPAKGLYGGGVWFQCGW